MCFTVIAWIAGVLLLIVCIAQSVALGDPCLRTIQAGDVIQLERKGFFRCDKPYGGSADKPCVLFAIPDGKVKATAISTTAATASKEAAKKAKK